MLTSVIALVALVIPHALELYFDEPNESIEDEFIPDGR